MKFRMQRLGIVLSLAFALSANLVCGSTSSVEFTGGGNQIFDLRADHRPLVTAVSEWIPEVEGGVAFDLSLDSRADILLIDATLTDIVGGTIYNAMDVPPVVFLDYGLPHWPFHGPRWPNEQLYHHLYAVDLWVTTPGGTSSANWGPNTRSLVDGETVTHFDTTDEGAQDDFHFASVTLVPDSPGGMATVTLLMSIQTAADPVPIVDDVAVTMTINPVPEPSSTGFVLFALLFGMAASRKRRFSRHSSRELVK